MLIENQIILILTPKAAQYAHRNPNNTDSYFYSCLICSSKPK